MIKVVELSGGVGGARLARGLDRVDDIDLTVVVNVGDDDVIHGLHISPDLDTVVYTLKDLEGRQGWGRLDDTFAANDEFAGLGADNRFQLGDRDLALNILRTDALRRGETLSEFTASLTKHLGIAANVLPATNEPLRTMIGVTGETISFQEYFVMRQSRDEVLSVTYEGADESTPATGVIEAITDAELVVIAPSNPPLSIWPILAIPGIREVVKAHTNVVAVSPLFGGKALKGPADRVMLSLGLPAGNAGVEEAYKGLISRLIVDDGDHGDRLVSTEMVVADTRIADPDRARDFALSLLS